MPRSDKCEKCASSLEICTSNEPYHQEHWICPKCDSTYNIDTKSKDDKSEDNHPAV
jgi:transposase-like protein